MSWQAVAQTQRRPVNVRYRWVQLGIGVVCMMAVANIQYSWTLFVPELVRTFGWSRASLQSSFTIFIVTQVLATPIVGTIIDRFGLRPVIMLGGLTAALSWVIDSASASLGGFYLGAIIGGISAGCVNACAVNSALKWFPDRRGLAVGLMAAGYGSGTIFTVLPIAHMIATSGFARTFFVYGVIQGAIILVAGYFMRSPQPGHVPYSTTVVQSTRDFSLGEALHTPVLWLLMIMFACVATGGLMVVAQLSLIAKDFGIADVQVDAGLFSMAALPFALMLDRITNGISRPLFGWISDHIGREVTMLIAFTLEAIGMLALATFGKHPAAFIALSGVAFLAWGEIYSLFAATIGDVFGTKSIGKIYGVLFLSAGFASFFVPIANLIEAATGTWATVFYITATMDLVAALSAFFILRPLLRRHYARHASNLSA
ncbi:MAG: oxalate/formate MFS antiporter [Casimicrobiaceae bacterium]